MCAVMPLPAPNAAVEAKLALVTEVRDSMEIVNTPQYGNFLHSYFKPFQQVLESTAPQERDCPEHKLRNSVLEIFNRLPQNATLNPLLQDLMKTVLDVMVKDNEENAMICLRIVLDLHKNFRPNLEANVQPFLDFVAQVNSLLPACPAQHPLGSARAPLRTRR